MNKNTEKMEIEYIKVNKERAAQILRAMENEYEESSSYIQRRMDELASLFNLMPYHQLKQLKLDKMYELSMKYRAPFDKEKETGGKKNG